MTDPAFYMRTGQAGERVEGTPGNVLTLLADGRIRPEAPPQGVAPLSDVFWVDGGAATEGDGSIGAPYKTLTAAVAAHAAGATFLVCPHDYSAEDPLNIPGSIKVQLIGVSTPGDGNAYIGVNAKIPGIVQIAGGEQGSLVLRNLECSGNLEIGRQLLAVDCIGVFVLGQGTDLGVVELRGGTCGGVTASSIIGVSGVALGSGAAFSTQTTHLSFADCSFAGIGVDVTFATDPGVVYYDLATEQNAVLAGGTAVNSVTNGTAQRDSLPVQSITGATTQLQVDSIVSALVALKLATDNR